MTTTPIPPADRLRRSLLALACVIAAPAVTACRSEPDASRADDTAVSMPVVEQKQFSILVRWPGATAAEVDELVATPISDSLKGFDDIDRVELISRDGEALALVTLSATIRDPEVELTRNGALQRISPRLPAEAEVVALPGDPTAPPSQVLVLTSERRAIDELAVLAGTLRTRLAGVDSVTAVELLGVRAPEVRVTLDPRRLAAYGLTSGAVAEAVRVPVEDPAGGPGRAGIEALERVLVRATDDGRVELRDVARISLDDANDHAALRLDGRGAVGLAVHGGAKVTGSALAAVVRPELPPGVSLGWVTGEPGAQRGLHVALRLPGGGAQALHETLARVEEAARRLPGGDSTLAWTRGPREATLLLRGRWTDPAALEEAADALHRSLGGLPGGELRVAPLDASGFSPRPAPVVVTVASGDLDALDPAASQVRTALSEIEGVRSTWSSESLWPVERVSYDRAAASRAGVATSALREALTLRDAGLVVAQLRDGQRIMPVRLVVPREDRDALTVRGADGALIPLSELVTVDLGVSRDKIERERRRVRVTLSAEVSGRDADDVRADVERALAALKLSTGVTAKLTSP